MTKTKKQKVVMPASIRSKMVSATAMLLVAAILMVSSTYAWFTLSTAPEVTGITTQVGANGNLEIALLTTDTYDSTASISSGTGDSMANTSNTVVKANTTWGNLIDLSDSSYGLSEISLLPASLNTGTSGTTNVVSTSPLSVPVYGADGRVNTVTGTTVSAIKSSGSFKVTSDQSYGVRAVGTADSLSAKAIALRSAKSGVNSSISAAKSNIVSAISNNAAAFAMLALQGDTTAGTITTLNKDQITAVTAIAEAMSTSLDNILAGYKYVAIAELTQVSNLSDEDFATAQQTINAASDATSLKNLITATDSKLTTDQQNGIKDQLTKIATDKATLAEAITTLKSATPSDGSETATDLSSVITNVLGTNIPHTKDGTTYYLTGGVLNDIAKEVSTFQLISAYGYTAYAGEKPTEADAKEGALAKLNTTVNGLTASSETTDANIVTTYGYAIDFAFRTNAADSSLQLQTAGANRVYTSETGGDLATQGAGSYVEFTLANSETADQATKLVQALRVVFYNPEDGSIYATAAVGDITNDGTTSVDATKVTGNLYLINDELTVTKAVLGKDMYEAVMDNDNKNIANYKIKETLNVSVTDGTNATKESVTPSASNCTNYTDTLSIADYSKLAAKTTTEKTTGLQSDKGTITALTQNTVQKVSTLVYLDGENIDNTAVVNASTSGSLNLNLQFSSSADLVPMDNSTLKTMEKTITASISGPDKLDSATATGSYTVSTNSSKEISKVEWTSGTTSAATVPTNAESAATTTVTLTGVNAATSEATTELSVKITFKDNSTVEAKMTVIVPAAAETTTSDVNPSS